MQKTNDVSIEDTDREDVGSIIPKATMSRINEARPPPSHHVADITLQNILKASC